MRVAQYSLAHTFHAGGERTPKAFHSEAQGRAARPGLATRTISVPQRGYTKDVTRIADRLCNPCGVDVVIHANPGCAARPWALEYNGFAVSLTTLFAAGYNRFEV